MSIRSLSIRSIIASPACAVMIAGLSAAHGANSRDTPFRGLPMEESTRTLAIALEPTRHVAFDPELLRSHTVWEGDGIELLGPPYTGAKTPFLCEINGSRLWTTPPVFPWSTGPSPGPDRSELPSGAAFKGVSTKAETPTLLYEVPDGSGNPVEIQETPRATTWDGHPVVVRRLVIGPAADDLWFLAHGEPEATLRSGASEPPIIQTDNGELLGSAAVATTATEWRAFETNAHYKVPRYLADGADSRYELKEMDRHETRAYLKIPADPAPRAVEIWSLRSREGRTAGEEIPRFQQAQTGSGRADPPDLGRVRDSTPEATEPPDAIRGPQPPDFQSGNEYYPIEHFPVPEEVDLLVGGMDWLPDGSLAVATWPGEVYILEGLDCDPETVRYRRFAEGLHEPLGLKVQGDQIYVLQKTELTRLIDTDANGRADLYETVNNDWGYTGNYHAYAFGPVIGPQDRFYVGLVGHRGVWEARYQGWAVEISPDGRQVTPLASGLRAPNGLARYGPNDDLFCTDNQGNWVGASKLNHLQPGKFYGHPASRPAPSPADWEPDDKTPPAVWFPYDFSPSPSDIATIPKDGFGPFGGQMVVGGFKQGSVMRVALERVQGEWQGAAWPLTRGFTGAVNRLSFGPDGCLYVGGCQRAWSTPNPKQGSLERVRFAGETPFEVHKAQAEPDGFTLHFTHSVNPTPAGKPDNYALSQFRYRYDESYGSPKLDHQGREDRMSPVPVVEADVSDDRRSVRLTVDGLKTGYITMMRLFDLVSANDEPIWNDTFYYTLNRLPRDEAVSR